VSKALNLVVTPKFETLTLYLDYVKSLVKVLR
jgi:hypothetical protein